MPKIKNRTNEDYDFTQPLKVSISGQNLPRYELDLKPQYPKEESELERNTKPFEHGPLPQTVCLPKFKRVKAGKYMVKVPVRKAIVVSKRSLAYDQDMAILAMGERLGIKPKKQ